MRRPKAKPRRALPISLADAIEARVASVIPMRQERAERLILELLRAEYGEKLEERTWGESETARAIGLVRAWRMG